ncbi:hypothetical protein [uncultured Intestinimonas sp.]|uniref:hypothetical protein n=1 Tax=uncultured Intestinimonas sp. TaxID=1689265 RepID=UPI0025F7955A|nr:hypothetical protein [uncultured Intestinimonas sp.]
METNKAMKKKINVTALSALLLLLFSAAVWVAIPFCIEEYSTATDIGPRAFPQLICATVCILCLLQLVLLILKIEKGTYVEFCPADLIPVLLAMGLALVAVIAALYINILIAGVLCAEAFLLLLKARDWRYYLAVVITGGVLYVLMKFIMHIRF